MIGWEALIHRTYRHEKMTRDKEDDDLGKKEDDDLEKTLPQPPVSMPQTLPAWLART